MMNYSKVIISLGLLISVFSLTSCDDFSKEKLTVETKENIQLYHKFSNYDLSAKYGDVEMKPSDLYVNSKSLDTSKVGNYEIEVSPSDRLWATKKVNVEVTNRYTANILSFGNSLNFDSLYYLQEIAKAEGMDYTAYIAINEEMTLDSMYESFNNSEIKYLVKKYNAETYLWQDVDYYSFNECLSLENKQWDFISFEQNSYLSGSEESYNKLNYILRNVDRHFDDKEYSKPSYIWNMSYAYSDNIQISGLYNLMYSNSQETMFDSIISNTKTNVLNNSNIDHIIPVGTLIQNLRANGIHTDETISGNKEYIINSEVKYAISLLYATYLSGFEPDYFAHSIPEESLTHVNENKLIEIRKAVKESISKPYEVSIFN